MDLMAGLVVESFMEIVKQTDSVDNRKAIVMFGAGILDSKIIGPFKFNDIVKINADNYGKFLGKAFFNDRGHSQEALI